MASIDNLEVKQLEEHLISGGFLSSFTDILGNTQPAPIFQTYELDLTDVSKKDRVVMIRETGNITSSTRFFFKQRPMLVLVVGQDKAPDSIIARGLAEDMEEYMVTDYGDEQCLINIESSGVTGPFITEDGRRAFEINIIATFNT